MGGDASHASLWRLPRPCAVNDLLHASPLYWTLQEFIYADGTLDEPIGWAAAREAAARPEFSEGARPLMVYAEAMFPGCSRRTRRSSCVCPAMDILMADTEFGHPTTVDQLARNEVPLRAAVYFFTMPMWTRLQLDTAWARAMLG